MQSIWQFFRPTSKANVAARRQRRTLSVECLEDRRLLASGSLPHVAYHGGPLLQNAQIESVFYGQPWSTSTNLQQLVSQVDGFLQYLPTSAYMSVLKQYNVGNGSFENDVVLAQ